MLDTGSHVDQADLELLFITLFYLRQCDPNCYVDEDDLELLMPVSSLEC